ncbi:hypothetical protein ACVILI_006511 [Mesorhizobium sp. USDA 4775]|uniref:glutamate cyclase domain-containing protein n=1 Tax=Mesorhizobium jarvisii TaxID=1777867 RepID=UPI00049ABCF6|nr:glutamate cyclase domain-containing protein [Mesorhizobium jarvisii]MCH4561196.1 DUF4392 domain-containing protein [Mesorhizobium jarvisii]
MDYFQYLTILTTQDDLDLRLGNALDTLMALDLNLTGRVQRFYQACRGERGDPLSTTAAKAILDAVGKHEVALFVTGCAVRPEIDVSIGELDGPAGAAALARSLFLTRGVVSVVVVAEPLVPQIEAAFRAAGASIVSPSQLNEAKKSRSLLFAVSIVGMPNDEALHEAAVRLFDHVKPKVVVAIESLGIATDGKGYFSTGRAFERGVLRSDAIFAEASMRGIVRLTCFDNPNESGTGRLHTSDTKHPPIADDFEFLIPGTNANWAAFAIAAAIAGIEARPEAAITPALDVAAVEASLRAGSIDPFSGMSDPLYGIDTMEMGCHDTVTGLMARAAKGFVVASARGDPR